MKSKKVFISAIVCIVMIFTAALFVACDENDRHSGTHNNDEGLTFEEGTTVDDILKMFDDGTVTSCTWSYSHFFNGTKDRNFVYRCNRSIMYCSHRYDYDLFEYYYLYEIDKVYLVACADIGNEFRWSENVNNEDGFSTGLDNIQYFSSKEGIIITIDGDRLTLREIYKYPQSEDYGEAVITVYDFNKTSVSLPEKYANYKEIATEVEFL